MTLKELGTSTLEYLKDIILKLREGNFWDLEIFQFILVVVIGLFFLWSMMLAFAGLVEMIGDFKEWVHQKIQDIRTYDGNSRLYKFWLYLKFLPLVVFVLFLLIVGYVVIVLEK